MLVEIAANRCPPESGDPLAAGVASTSAAPSPAGFTRLSPFIRGSRFRARRFGPPHSSRSSADLTRSRAALARSSAALARSRAALRARSSRLTQPPTSRPSPPASRRWVPTAKWPSSPSPCLGVCHHLRTRCSRRPPSRQALRSHRLAWRSGVCRIALSETRTCFAGYSLAGVICRFPAGLAGRPDGLLAGSAQQSSSAYSCDQEGMGRCG